MSLLASLASSGLWFLKPICLQKLQNKVVSCPHIRFSHNDGPAACMAIDSTIETTNDHQSTTHLLTYFKVAIFFVKRKTLCGQRDFLLFFSEENLDKNPPRDCGVKLNFLACLTFVSTFQWSWGLNFDSRSLVDGRRLIHHWLVSSNVNLNYFFSTDRKL